MGGRLSPRPPPPRPRGLTRLRRSSGAAAAAVASAAALLTPPAAARAQGTAVLAVPAATSVRAPVAYPDELQPGERLVVEVEGEVRGFTPDEGGDEDGDVPAGALVASFAGGPPFLIGTGRLLWAAPARGRLTFAVAGDATPPASAGGYTVRVTPIGPPGDPRQRRFPPPRIRFLPAARGGGLEVAYDDAAGFGLDLLSLKVFLETRDGRRVVLSRHFAAGSRGARLERLPADLPLPSGLHSVTATIADRLGNVSPPASAFWDRP